MCGRLGNSFGDRFSLRREHELKHQVENNRSSKYQPKEGVEEKDVARPKVKQQLGQMTASIRLQVSVDTGILITSEFRFRPTCLRSEQAGSQERSLGTLERKSKGSPRMTDSK